MRELFIWQSQFDHILVTILHFVLHCTERPWVFSIKWDYIYSVPSETCTIKVKLCSYETSKTITDKCQLSNVLWLCVFYKYNVILIISIS